MAVTLFEDMKEGGKAMYVLIDPICGARRWVRYATLEKSHLFV